MRIGKQRRDSTYTYHLGNKDLQSAETDTDIGVTLRATARWNGLTGYVATTPSSKTVWTNIGKNRKSCMTIAKRPSEVTSENIPWHVEIKSQMNVTLSK
jgi:hypothetical protein